jgi:hypothetical protein
MAAASGLDRRPDPLNTALKQALFRGRSNSRTSASFGAECFAQMNAEYPSNGPWRFILHRVVGGEGEAVTDVGVTDGVQSVRALSFFTASGGKIVRLVEYWPEPYPAPANRAHLVEAMDSAE